MLTLIPLGLLAFYDFSTNSSRTVYEYQHVRVV